MGSSIRRHELTLVRASAGSGKTYTLVHRWLELALREPRQFRRILALTFTNKATAEMKLRIVSAVAALARGDHPMLASLSAALPGVNVVAQAEVLLSQMLHHYSWLAVQTIESFFVKVVRGFARELQLELAAELELKTDLALDAAVDHLMAQIGRQPEVTDWLARYAMSQISEDRGWQVEGGLRRLGNDLFKERLEGIMEGAAAERLSISSVAEVLTALEARVAAYRRRQREIGHDALRVMELYSLGVDDFKRKNSGPGGYLAKLAQGEEVVLLNTYVSAALEDPGGWMTKGSKDSERIGAAVEGGLQGLLAESAELLKQAWPTVKGAQDALKLGYALPLLRELSEGLRVYREQRGVVLISDVAALLDVVLKGAETSFVYEKLGVRFQHVLLDEFQDTSVRQWRNLRPLAEEALATGNSVLVVGDAKQSIYRWRSGELRLLLGLAEEFAAFAGLVKPLVLDSNRRSGAAIVGFNNRLFAEAARLVAAKMPTDEGRLLLQDAYGAGLAQTAHAQREGYVEVSFVAPTEEQKVDELALALMSQQIADCRADGYGYGQLAVLVRSNEEGLRVAEHLLSAAGGRVPVQSAESLKLTASPRVNVLLSALELLSDPGHGVARAHVSAWISAQKGIGGEVAPEAVIDALLQRRRERLAGMLVTLSGELQRLLSLGSPDAFVQRFDQALMDYQRREAGDVAGFLRWWGRHGHDLAITAPEGADAVTILTLHKAKGLQWPVVLLPFAKWPLRSDGRTTLWARPDRAPFDQLPVVPIAASGSAPDETDVFRATRVAEYEASVVDGLNLLYVALTRPEDRLYVIAPEPSESGRKNLTTAGDVLAQALAADRARSGAAEEGPGNVYRFGRREPVSAPRRQRPTQAAGPTAYATQADPMGGLQIRRRMADVDMLLESRRVGPIRWGQVVHTALQRLSSLDELERVLTSLSTEGLVASDELPHLRQVMEAFVASEAGQGCFEAGWQVRTEAELMTAAGERLRPDRILTQGERARVIEFKAGRRGAAEAAHRAQVQGYMGALRAMGYDQVSAELIYLDGPERLEVA